MERDGGDGEPPELGGGESGALAEEEGGDREEDDASDGRGEGRPSVAEGLEHGGAGEDEAGGDEVPGDDFQVFDAEIDDGGVVREEADQAIGEGLAEERDDEHEGRGHKGGGAEGVADAGEAAGSEVLTGEGRGGEADGHHGQKDRLHDAAADAEAGLCGGAEGPEEPIDEGRIDGDERELAARGESDGGEAFPGGGAGTPEFEFETDVVFEAKEVDGHGGDAGEHGDEGGDGGSCDAVGAAGDPAGDEDGGEDGVDEHGHHLDGHGGLDDAGAAEGGSHGGDGELASESGDVPLEVSGAFADGGCVGGEGLAVGEAEGESEGDDGGSGEEREEEGLIEDEIGVVAILAADGVRDERGGADAEHLGEGEDGHHGDAGEGDAGDGLFAERGDEVEIDEEVEGLEDHAHAHEGSERE